MNNRVVGVKKSRFNALTGVNPDATLDFVYNDTNYKITFADFLAALGVSGTIEQAGDPTDFPVLNIAGSVNQIRNLAEGFGIGLIIEPSGSISISTDFSFNDTGIALVDDVTSESPVFRSLVSGVGIGLNIEPSGSISISTGFTYDTTGAPVVDNPLSQMPNYRSFVAGSNVTIDEAAGTLTFNAVPPPAPTPAKQVLVNSPSDFPAPVSDVITLESNQYLIGDNVDIGTNRFELIAGTSFKGLNKSSTLTSTTTGNLFTASDALGIWFTELTVSAPSATLFNVIDTVQGTTEVALSECIVTVDNLGSIGNVAGINWVNCNFFGLNDGLTIAPGLTDLISLRQCFMVSSSATFKGIDFGTATSQAIEFRDIAIAAPVGAYGISGLINNGNVVSGFVANVESCDFTGGVTALENITTDDYRWFFIGNSGIKNTNPVGLLSMNGNATLTTITAANTPVLVAGTWVVNQTSHFTGTTAGRLTYDGEVPLTVSIDTSLSFEPDSGTNKVIACYVAINGTVVSQTGIGIHTDSGVPIGDSSIWEAELSQGDYIEAWVENRTDTNDVIVYDIVLRVT